MIYKLKFLFSLLLAIAIIFSCSEPKEKNIESFKVFDEVRSAHSGITFSNDLKPDVSTKSNLLDFDYFYNGAGVGVGDINNDGLEDVFFCGNQVDNKLYLNKGDLQFEDISDQAGINVGKGWANGVTFVDINKDGWLDIYVSQGGPLNKEDRKNKLYINNQDLSFTESANTYGLDDEGITTQSAFFDFDKDGDMDCIVMNESDYYGLDPVTFHRILIEREQDAYTSYSHMYKNENGTFKDVTIESGITSPTFGLGLAISDFNQDGWLDIYMANDYYQPDNLYINKKNGTFSDRSKAHLNQMSFFGMGLDVADVNNDGLQDIFVLDMAAKDHVRSKTLMASMDLSSFDLLVNTFGFPYQYMFNSLMINDGGNRYNNVAHLSGVASTDWSWSALINDYDQDGLQDIFVSNGYRKYATDNDFKSKVNQAKAAHNNRVPLDVKQELYNSIPSESLPNIVFQQSHKLKFVEVQDKWGLEKSTYSNGAASADLDNDGDLDLLINNIDQEALLYENKASDHHNYLNVKLTDHDAQALVRISYNGEERMSEVKRVRGYMSSVEPIAHFGIGNVKQIDRVEVEYLDGSISVQEDVGANQTLIVDKPNNDIAANDVKKAIRKFGTVPAVAFGINYTHQENVYNDFSKEVLLPYKQSSYGPCIAKADVNGDGIEDVFLGGAKGQSALIYLSAGASYTTLHPEAFDVDKIYEDVAATFTDVDMDGDKDLIVLSGGNAESEGSVLYKDRIYINDSNNWNKSSLSIGDEAHVGGAVVEIDYDQDGDMDILIGNRIVPQKYPLAAPSRLLENREGEFIDVTKSVMPELLSVGIVNDIEVSDINNDGWMDVITVGEWEQPWIFENNEGVLELRNISFKEKGLWFSVTATDVDGDGDQDYVLGNIGENYKLKASSESPLLVYAGDLDENKTHDLVLSKKYNGEYVPVRGKECSTEQLPFIQDKFESYQEYASSSLIDVYGSDNLSETYKKSVTTTSSMLLINEGDFNFSVQELPIEMQAFPVRDVLSVDLNDDGLEDLIAVGTIYDTEVETPRLDAGCGLVLLNEGGSYRLDNQAYYLYISGDLRSIDLLDGIKGEKRKIIVMRNNGTPALISI